MGITQSKRIDNYVKQNGSNKITPRQARRIKHKANKLLRRELRHDTAWLQTLEKRLENGAGFTPEEVALPTMHNIPSVRQM